LEAKLKRQAKQLGYELVPIDPRLHNEPVLPAGVPWKLAGERGGSASTRAAALNPVRRGGAVPVATYYPYMF